MGLGLDCTQSTIFRHSSPDLKPYQNHCDLQEIAHGINMLAAEQVDTFFESILIDP
jgi:hypothetical protein